MGTKTGKGATVDVVALMDGKAAVVLWECVAAGALVSISTTRDGGALGVTVTVDGEWEREYVRSSEDLDSWVAEVAPVVKQLLEGGRASTEPAQRSRRPRSR